MTSGDVRVARRLFPDTKAPEYFPQQILAGEFAGNFSQRALRQTQIFGK
jgi:hypothetical protein